MNNNFSRRDFLKTGAVITAGLSLGLKLNNQFDVIIKNGKIADGTGSILFKADVGINGDKIEAIGDLSSSSANLIIDAEEHIVSPGFIDIHTHTDTELIVNPKGESKIRQGVTTEVSGNCGSSPFPYTDEDFEIIRESFKKRYDEDINWKDITGFLRTLEEKKISLNYATFTGSGDLRAYVVGKNDVQPSPEQLKKMKELLAEDMKNGSFGLSTGLEYAPGSYASTDELIELAKVVAEHHGIYNTHMRNEDDRLEEAIQEALKICKEAGVKLEIAHLKTSNPANWHKIENVLNMIDKAAESGLPVNADRYPYVAYATGLSALLPLWARQGNTDEILKRMEVKDSLPAIKEYVSSRAKRIGGWKNFVISYCISEKNKKWEGKSILESAEIEGLEPTDFVIQILKEEKLQAGMVGFAMNEDNLKRILAHKLVMIGSDGNATAPYGKLGTGKPHPRYYGTFPRVLGKYCREDKIFDFPTAVKKMTSMAADKLGLKGRGYLKKNYFADIVVFNPLTVLDKANFTDPHQYPDGIKYVFVNGVLTIKDGEHTGAYSGAVLRHTV
ncbi:MAG TPA: amidohydrolase family protein [Ignavibacteriaceae bacterium]|nr:amidohydrolase family protein [Ignavibacteriaceae bacterium]